MLFTPFAFMAEAGGGPYVPTDADAIAYINEVETQGGTLSTTDKEAIDNLYIGLKADGLYSKMKYMYPFMGGIADSHAVDGVQPTDANYTITWGGGLTSPSAHTSEGIDGSGLTSGAIGSIARNPQEVHNSINNITLGAYVSTAVTDDGNFVQVTDVGSTTRYQMNIPFDGNIVYGGIGQNNFVTYDNGVAPVGRWVTARIATTSIALWKNGSLVAENTTFSSGTLSTNDIAIFSSTQVFNGVCGFVFSASGMNSPEVATFDARLATFLTAIGRL